MGAINLPELVQIGNSLETSLISLKQLQKKLESTWPVVAVDEYFQILFTVARVNEGLERLQKIIRERKEISRQGT
jgi:hypothetical protein